MRKRVPLPGDENTYHRETDDLHEAFGESGNAAADHHKPIICGGHYDEAPYGSDEKTRESRRPYSNAAHYDTARDRQKDADDPNYPHKEACPGKGYMKILHHKRNDRGVDELVQITSKRDEGSDKYGQGH